MVGSRCSCGSGSVYVVAVVYDDGSEDDGGDDGNGGEGDGDDVICEVGVEDGSGGRVATLESLILSFLRGFTNIFLLP